MTLYNVLCYSELACRDDQRQAPFERLAARPLDFIDAEYMPTDISIKEPRNMKLDALVKFFKHVSEREISHGVADAFRFKSVLHSRKKGEFRRARYKEDGDELGEDNEDEVPQAPKRRKRRKAQPQENEDHHILNAQTEESSARTLQSDSIPIQTPATSLRLSATSIESSAPSCEHNDTSATLHTGLYTPEKTPAPERRNSLSPATATRVPKNINVRRPELPPPAQGPSTTGPRRSQRHLAEPSGRAPSERNSKTRKKIG